MSMINSRNSRSNITLIQLIFSIAIIYFHSYKLGDAAFCGWARFVFGKTTIGGLVVNGFLVLSGFCLSRNFSQRYEMGYFPTLSVYFVRRLFRIFPVVLTGTLFAVFVIGPVFTTLTLSDYFTNGGTWIYLQHLLLFVRPPVALPGVFDGNVYPQVVNGVMWMIPWQMWFYALFGVLLALRLHRDRVVALTLLCVALAFSANGDKISPTAMFCGIWTHDGVRLLPYFAFGWAAEVWGLSKYCNVRIALILACVLPIWFRSPAREAACCVIGGYVLLTLAFATRPLKWVQKVPPISFGVFIFGFMVQQSLVAYCGGKMPHTSNFILATLFTIPLALAQYYTVEKYSRALREHIQNWILGFNSGGVNRN